MKRVIKIAVMSVPIILLSACSNQVERIYEQSSYGVPLEVPPDLSKPTVQEDELSLLADDGNSSKKQSGTNCDCVNNASTMPVLAPQEGLQLKRDGAHKWIVLQGEPRNLWPWVRDFWNKNGFKINLEDPVIGLVETDWKQQRSNLPMQKKASGAGQEAVGQDKVESRIYAVPVMEKYRTRLEKGEQPGTTDLFVTHRGVELVNDGKLIVWKLRKSDAELEAEMIQRMMVFFTKEQQNIGAPLATRNQQLNIAAIIKNEKDRVTLKVDVEFVRLWKRIGLVLDRMDYIIEDTDRSIGTYYLRAKDPLKEEGVKEEKGWFASLFSDDEDLEHVRIQVALRDEGESTHINIQNQKGELIKDEDAKTVLEQIMSRLQ